MSAAPKVAILTGPGMSLFEFSAAYEVFGGDYSGTGRPWYSTVLCGSSATVSTNIPGVAFSGVRPLSKVRGVSLVIVPPMRPDPETLSWLRDVHRRGARIASLCTGAFVLGEAGLLEGRRVTTHWGDATKLATRYPGAKVDPDVLYVDDGDILTSAGSAAGIDLCLYLVQSEYGAEVANRVARDLVVPPHRSGGQAQFVTAPILDTADAGDFAETLDWALQHLDRPLGVSEMARRAGMSSRTFARRFRAALGMTPHQWVVRQRVLLAQRLLEGTGLSIDRVAEQSGLGSPANLRLQFRLVLHTTPTSYRRTFQEKAG